MSSSSQQHRTQGAGRRATHSRSPQAIPANAFPSMNVLSATYGGGGPPTPAQQYTPVPLSHPPLLSELQSRSHQFSPARRQHSRTPSNHNNQVGTSTIPTQVFPSNFPSPGSTPTSPIPGGGITPHTASIPLVNILNLNGESPGNSFYGNSPSPTPVAFGGNSSGTFPAPNTLPPSTFSLSQSMDGSVTLGHVADKVAELESFLPSELLSESDPHLVGELPEPVDCLSGEEQEGTKSAAEIPKTTAKPRVLTRVVKEPWTQVFPATVNGTRPQSPDGDCKESSTTQVCPEARFGHVAVVRSDHAEMVIFGGRQTGVCYDDLWVADLESSSPDQKANVPTGAKTMKWRQIKRKSTSSIWPTPRAGHTATINADGTEMLVFGGGTETEFYGQLYSFNFLTEEWTLLTDFCEDVSQRNYDAQIRPRKGHTSIWDQEEQAMYVYGGMLSLEAPVKDPIVWRYDRRTNSWAPMPSSGQQPPDRMYHVAGYDDHRKQMLIFGGRVISPNPGYPFLGDLFSFDMKTCVWTKIESQQSTNSKDVIEAPKPRMCAASLFHNGRFYVSHGGHTRYLNDSFEFDMKQKRWFRSSPTPTPLTRPTVVLHRDTITCFGGCDHEIFVNDCHQMKLVQPSLFELCAEWLNNEAEAIPASRPSKARVSTKGVCPTYSDPMNSSLTSLTPSERTRPSTTTIPSIVLPPPMEREDGLKHHCAQDVLPQNVLHKAQRLLSQQRALPTKDPVVHVHTQHFF